MVKDDCSQECTCNAPESAMQCVDKQCHEDTVCEVREGVRDCYCKEGHEGDGQNCVGKLHNFKLNKIFYTRCPGFQLLVEFVTQPCSLHRKHTPCHGLFSDFKESTLCNDPL